MINYQPVLAADYGITFGEVTKNGIFKRMSNDCTNFVSQCIWAGYGGTEGLSLLDPKNLEPLRERVERNYRQTWSWFGRHANSPYDLGSLAFIQVETFWNYMLASYSKGPKAKGYNNQKSWKELKERIEQGDVVQFYNDVLNRYGHSALVVSKGSFSITEDLDKIYVAQHSFDYSYRPLADAIYTNGGMEKAKIRLLKFLPANF